MNLAQAVLLIGWSWWDRKDKKERKILDRLASQSEVESFLIFLESSLREKEYFQWPDKELRMLHNLRNIFVRNELTSSEIKTLYRVVKTLSVRKK